MSAREEFEKLEMCKYLDLEMDKDAWDRPKYKHSHVQCLYEGYQAGLEAAAKVCDDYAATIEQVGNGAVEGSILKLGSESCAKAIRKLKDD